ncbi:type IV secretory system conjugative DNA transfer family protein [Arthrobacter sp. B2I5]|uniref:type IV secretory system conjugative DNA transfer family protein n=1 Tax=Arthrobacter sp. B2I5 TaxID=3042266 RepID=UPI0027D77CD4|nr:type IV secretory system conjugative DNA transfer family protein [Arthrobacter sp. B2I5]
MASQEELDRGRKTYLITFPAELKTPELLNWLRQVSGTIHRDSLLTIPTIVFETWANDREIIHRLSMPWQDADYIIGQLQGLIPGIGAIPDEARPRKEWDLATEYRIHRTEHPIVVKDSISMSTSMLLTLGHLEKGESAILQWIIAPAGKESMGKPNLTITEALLGVKPPSNEHIASLKAKQDEPNFLGSFRIGVNAVSPARRRHLTNLLFQPLASTGRFKVAFNFDGRALAHAVTRAGTPWLFGCQVSASELLAFMTWPLGSPLISGLPSGATRHLPPTEAIPRQGRILGLSTYPGTERPIAMSHLAAATHVFIGGGTGVGKTTLMANTAKQDMEAGHGLFVMEAKGDLFYEVSDYVPYNRLDDVVIIDFTDGLRPVGFNLLDQGNPRTVVDELVELFQFKYKDNGVWFRELMFHGLMTLATVKGLTFNDLSPLISPRDPDERAWSEQIIKGVKDRELIKFWHRWNQLKDSERVQHAGVVENRIWQIIGRIEPRYLFGQSTSSFQMEDVIRENKILLVNLSGIPKESAEIVGTLLFNAYWEAAQRVPTERENYVYLDEFQMFADVPMGFDDVLALARKYKLGMVLATQYVERLPQNLAQAIKANARTKVIMQTNAEGANIWQHEFGSKAVDRSDITNLKAYQAIARINTESGISAPVTLKTLPPAKKAGTAKAATIRSNNKYGRSVADIERQEIERRKGAPSKRARPTIGWKTLDEQDGA